MTLDGVGHMASNCLCCRLYCLLFQIYTENSSDAMHHALATMGISIVFQRPLAVPLHSLDGRQMSAVRVVQRDSHIVYIDAWPSRTGRTPSIAYDERYWFPHWHPDPHRTIEEDPIYWGQPAPLMDRSDCPYAGDVALTVHRGLLLVFAL